MKAVTFFMSTLLIFSFQAHSQVSFGYTWKKCESPIYDGSTFPFDDKLRPRKECFPDTLYSWTKLSRVEETIKNKKESELFPVRGNLYLWRTPLGSYGYGETVIRFKLKPNVSFVPLIISARNIGDKYCNNIIKKYGEQINTTVFVANLTFSPGYHEFILCSDGAIDSLSYGTPEIEKEVLKEKEWIESHDVKDFDLLFKKMPVPWFSKKETLIYDQANWSKTALMEKLKFLNELSSDNVRGNKIYFSSDSSSRDEHYHTSSPNYFNSNDE